MPHPAPTLIAALFGALVMTFAPPALAADPPKAIEQALTTMQTDKRGITLHVGGQAIGGAVQKVEPGQVVELRGPQGVRIVVRLDRIDAITLP